MLGQELGKTSANTADGGVQDWKRISGDLSFLWRTVLAKAYLLKL